MPGQRARAARDFICAEGGDTELVTVSPAFIPGPTLTTRARSRPQLIKAMLDGRMPVARRQRFGVAGVRDAADARIRAMAAPGPPATATSCWPAARPSASCKRRGSCANAPAARRPGSGRGSTRR
jgi:hypothetical protein